MYRYIENIIICKTFLLKENVYACLCFLKSFKENKTKKKKNK